jgi:hypothetical protein
MYKITIKKGWYVAMGKQEILNLNKIVSTRIHTPRVDGNPIYARVDGGMDTGDKDSGKTEKWSRVVANSYTSPDNIRRVFITCRAVYTHLYQPIYGYKDKSLRIEKKMGADFVSLLSARFEQGIALPCRVKGNGLSAIYKPWVCSNIEEIYFDSTLLLSEDIFPGGREYIDSITEYGSCALPVESIQELFMRYCMDGVTDISSRYPRLRAIGHIALLSDIYDNFDYDSKSGRVWADNEIVMGEVQEHRANVCLVGSGKEMIGRKSLKSNIYMFDRNVLENYFEKLSSIAMEQSRSNSEKISTEKSVNNDGEKGLNKSELELLLDKILEASNEEILAKSIAIAMVHVKDEVKQSELDSMSERGRALYGKYFEVSC